MYVIKRDFEITRLIGPNTIAQLGSPWVFWLDCSVSPKYEPGLDQSRLICCRSVPNTYYWE